MLCKCLVITGKFDEIWENCVTGVRGRFTIAYFDFVADESSDTGYYLYITNDWIVDEPGGKETLDKDNVAVGARVTRNPNWDEDWGAKTIHPPTGKVGTVVGYTDKDKNVFPADSEHINDAYALLAAVVWDGDEVSRKYRIGFGNEYWLARTPHIPEGCFNRFNTVTGGGDEGFPVETWEVRVYGNGEVQVSKNGVVVQNREDAIGGSETGGSAGYGPSPNAAFHHAIYELRFPANPGTVTVELGDPARQYLLLQNQFLWPGSSFLRSALLPTGPHADHGHKQPRRIRRQRGLRWLWHRGRPQQVHGHGLGRHVETQPHGAGHD